MEHGDFSLRRELWCGIPPRFQIGLSGLTSKADQNRNAKAWEYKLPFEPQSTNERYGCTF